MRSSQLEVLRLENPEARRSMVVLESDDHAPATGFNRGHGR